MSLASNGRSQAQPEVIVSFGDGHSYSRTKLDEIARTGFFDPKPAVAKSKETSTAKKDDIEYIVREMEITRADAERVLNDHGGELESALRTLVYANWGSSGTSGGQ